MAPPDDNALFPRMCLAASRWAEFAARPGAPEPGLPGVVELRGLGRHLLGLGRELLDRARVSGRPTHLAWGPDLASAGDEHAIAVLPACAEPPWPVHHIE